jgi:hypothetical protein
MNMVFHMEDSVICLSDRSFIICNTGSVVSLTDEYKSFTKNENKQNINSLLIKSL